jgi:tetratricopeptide (TPR) repeat protein
MRPNRTCDAGVAALLLTVTFLAYSPCLRGRFLWDDDAYISQDVALTSTQGLHDIWLKPGSVQQYYPVTFTMFWIEYHVWGLNPLGYHIINVLLHTANALLLWMILEGLGISDAWIAAWLFALHPVLVESVAWMTELKNVLSTFFYLLTLLCLLRKNSWAILLFLCALLSKSVTATLPVSFLLVSAWMKGAWDKKMFSRMLPLVGLGLSVSLFTIHVEHHLVRAQGPAWDFTWPQRMIIAGRAFWFYLAKLLYPSPLLFIYPKWSIDPAHLLLYGYPIAAVAFLGALAYGRRWWGKMPLACFLFFAISLSPALGFSSFYFMRYSFAADHFQYLASLGMFTLAGWALSRLLALLLVPESSPVGIFLIGFLCVDLALATAKQAGTYVDSMHLWEHTLDFNPDAAIAHHNIGIAYSERGQWKDAIAHLRTAEALDPSFAQTHLALAYFAVRAQRWEDARHQYQEAIRLGINDPQVLKDFAALPADASASKSK